MTFKNALGKKISLVALIGTIGVMSSLAQAAPVDLSTWQAEGTQANWVLQSGNNAVKQFVNGLPTVFHNNQNSQGNQLSGEITVETTGDDDFIGFVLGYNSGELTSNTADYILIDWKQGNQNFAGGTGKRGLAISSVSGVIGTNTTEADAWLHQGVVTELQRATNLGNTGWVDNQTYSFDLVFTANLIEVFVDNVKELSVTGNFSNGAFGFYNYSQANVLYAGITEDVAPPPPSAVPVPAAAWLFGSGLLGFAGMRRRKA